MTLGNPERAIGGLAVARPAGIELRPLGRDDFEIALSLVRELYDLPHTESAVHRARFDSLIGDVDASPFLAVGEGEPAGIIIFRFRRRMALATYEGWVSDLYVREAYRRRGIGRALLAAAIAEWRLRGGHQLVLETAHTNLAARALYESIGFLQAGTHFQQRPMTLRAPPTGVTPRPIEPSDLEAVRALLGFPIPPAERLASLEQVFAAHLHQSDLIARLTVVDGAPAGIVALQLREPFFATAPQAWIAELAVAEAARRGGIGRGLLESALAEAARHGANAAVLECDASAETRQLLAREGFQDVGSSYRLARATSAS
ncbi:MAG: GNAT family N-acetyltransferase [Chloroflexota bacterium]|nr:GNAT family N-acetyltransferase [Chloroflexota bacterium]